VDRGASVIVLQALLVGTENQEEGEYVTKVVANASAGVPAFFPPRSQARMDEREAAKAVEETRPQARTEEKQSGVGNFTRRRRGSPRTN